MTQVLIGVQTSLISRPYHTCFERSLYFFYESFVCGLKSAVLGDKRVWLA
jgi:hypothetical protein